MKVRWIAIVGLLVIVTASSVALAAPAANANGQTTKVEQQNRFQDRLAEWMWRFADWAPGFGGGNGSGTCDQVCSGTGDCDCDGDGDRDRMHDGTGSASHTRQQDRIHEPGTGTGDSGSMNGKRNGGGTGICPNES